MLNEVKHLGLACREKQIPRCARNDKSGGRNNKRSGLNDKWCALEEVILIDKQNVRHPEPVEGCLITLKGSSASFDEAQDGICDYWNNGLAVNEGSL